MGKFGLLPNLLLGFQNKIEMLRTYPDTSLPNKTSVSISGLSEPATSSQAS
jgi:hypothetical protein